MPRAEILCREGEIRTGTGEKVETFSPVQNTTGVKERNFIPPVLLRGEKKGRQTKMSGIQPQLAERESRTAGKSQVRPNPATHGQSESETSVSPRSERAGRDQPGRGREREEGRGCE